MRRYVHYGAPSYDPELFQAIHNGGYHNKPKGGLWLSPVDAEKSWEKWCQLAEHPVHNAGEPGTSFEIEIADDARWRKLTSSTFSGRWFCLKLRRGYSADTIGELIERVENRLESLERWSAPRKGEDFGHKDHWDRRRRLGLPLNPARKALQQLKPWYELDPQLLADMLNT